MGRQSLPIVDWERTGSQTKEGQNHLSIIMERIKAQTERRKQRSQALEKTARLKKKREISEKKEQKAEVKRKIEESSRRENRKIILDEDSLPILPPGDKFRCSSCTAEYRWWRGWVCLDEEKHLREWMVKERRVIVKDAFQEQAKQANGFSKLRKLRAAKKFEFSSEDLDNDDGCFSDEDCDNSEDSLQKPNDKLEDLSAFLVKNSGDR